jgi:hypothetical protein
MREYLQILDDINIKLDQIIAHDKTYRLLKSMSREELNNLIRWIDKAREYLKESNK